MSENKSGMGISYKCIQCATVITSDQLSTMLGIKCPTCGYRVLRKLRPPIVKRVKAR